MSADWLSQQKEPCSKIGSPTRLCTCVCHIRRKQSGPEKEKGGRKRKIDEAYRAKHDGAQADSFLLTQKRASSAKTLTPRCRILETICCEESHIDPCQSFVMASSLLSLFFCFFAKFSCQGRGIWRRRKQEGRCSLSECRWAACAHGPP